MIKDGITRLCQVCHRERPNRSLDQSISMVAWKDHLSSNNTWRNREQKQPAADAARLLQIHKSRYKTHKSTWGTGVLHGLEANKWHCRCFYSVLGWVKTSLWKLLFVFYSSAVLRVLICKHVMSHPALVTAESHVCFVKWIHVFFLRLQRTCCQNQLLNVL